MALWTHSFSREIAGSEEVAERIATRCAWQGSELFYVEDHRISIYFDAIDLGNVIEDPDNRPHPRFAVVARTNDPALRHQWLVVAREPLSSYWAYTCRFLPPVKVGTAERERLAEQHLAHSPDIHAALNAMTSTPLETTGLTACCLAPERPRDESTAKPTVYRKTAGDKRPRALWGIAPDLMETRARLLGSDVVCRLREETESGWIRSLLPDGSDRLRLHDWTIGRAEDVMEGSILRALAGPRTLTPGASVAQRVRDLYISAMRGLNNRVDPDATHAAVEHEASRLESEPDLISLIHALVQIGTGNALWQAAQSMHIRQDLIKNPKHLVRLIDTFEDDDTEAETALRHARTTLLRMLGG